MVAVAGGGGAADLADRMVGVSRAETIVAGCWSLVVGKTHITHYVSRITLLCISRHRFFYSYSSCCRSSFVIGKPVRGSARRREIDRVGAARDHRAVCDPRAGRSGDRAPVRSTGGRVSDRRLRLDVEMKRKGWRPITCGRPCATWGRTIKRPSSCSAARRWWNAPCRLRANSVR